MPWPEMRPLGGRALAVSLEGGPLSSLDCTIALTPAFALPHTVYWSAGLGVPFAGSPKPR